MFTWTFIKIKEEDKYINVDLKESGGRGIYGFSIDLKNKPLLLKAFKVKELILISGKSFTSISDSPNTALEILLLETKTEKKYQKPSDKKIFDTIATALADMQEPDLSYSDSTTISRSIAKIWTEQDPANKRSKPSKKWLDKLNKAIQKKGGGEVYIENTKAAKKGLHAVLGPAYYFDLVSIYGRRITVLIGPYDKPIYFIKPKQKPLKQ